MAGENFEHDDKKQKTTEEPVKFEHQEKSDLEKIQEKLNRSLGVIEKFAKEEHEKRNLKDKEIDSPEGTKYISEVRQKIEDLNITLTPNERQALNTLPKYNSEQDIVMVEWKNGLPSTFSWRLLQSKGEYKITAWGSVG